MNPYIEVSRNVVTGALVVVCIILISAIFPFLAFTRIFIPMPLLFYRSKLGREQGIMILLLSASIVAILFGEDSNSLDFILIMDLMLIGFILGELFQRNISIEITLSITCSIVLLLTAFCLFYYAAKEHISVVSILSKYIDGNINSFLIACQETGISNEITSVLEEKKEYIVNFTLLTIPSVLVISLTIITWINILLAKQLLQKNNLNYPNFGKLNHWSAPENLIWLLILSGILILIDIQSIKIIGVNGLIIIFGIYFFQGIAIISFYLVKKKLSIPVKIIVYSIVFLNQIFLILVISIGVFDTWFDFRKIEAKKSDLSS